MIVIDASVAVKWTVREADHPAVLALLDLSSERIAPDLLLPETAYVLRKKEKRNEIRREQLLAGLAAVEAAIARFVPSNELIQNAAHLSFELDHSTYDCFYLACALGRGVLVTADQVFVEKCRAKGYGGAIMPLNSIDDHQLKAQIAISKIPAATLADVIRLAEKIDLTFNSLRDRALGKTVGRLKVISSEVYTPGFNSPAYLRLVRELEKMSVDNLSLVVALGWLGRSYIRASEFPSLYANARQMTAEGFSAHRGYFVSLTPNVSMGLAKLKEFANDVQDL